MDAEQLKTVLSEYPMSRRLVVIVDGSPVWETSVAEVVIKLMREMRAPSGVLVTILGRDSCIVRERDNFSSAFPGNKWLEIDLR